MRPPVTPMIPPMSQLTMRETSRSFRLPSVSGSAPANTAMVRIHLMHINHRIRATMLKKETLCEFFQKVGFTYQDSYFENYPICI